MCVCVESGQKALNKLGAEEFDPIVLDNWMPTMIGTEVAKLIRQFNPTIPIVFYSAAGYEEDKQTAFDTGADVYLTKPLGVDLLLDEVERLCLKSWAAGLDEVSTGSGSDLVSVERGILLMIFYSDR
jgi:CheY-like chemotaxis protein